MIKILRNFIPPKNSSPYNPAQLVTIPNGSSVDITLQGRSGDIFGFDRILPGGADLNDITATALLNGEYTIFKDIKLSTIREFFLQKKLLAPYIIQEANTVVFTLTNNVGADTTVNLELLGYDAPALQKLISDYKRDNTPLPQPAFLYANATIPANATNFNVQVPTKSVDVEMRRAAVRTDSDANIVFSLQIWNDTVKNQVFVQQFNDEFQDNYSMVPFSIGKNVPFSLVVNNLDAANPYDLSFLGEAYVYIKGD